MKVYVLNFITFYPEVDGRGFILGVYSTREKAEEALKSIDIESLIYRDNKDIYGQDASELVIEEFELDEEEGV